MPNKPTNETTELAKERNREAADRTLASWIRNSIKLIGFGTGFDTIFTGLHEAFPDGNPALNLRMTHLIGLTAIGSGILLLSFVTAFYLVEINYLEREDYFVRSSHTSLSSILIFTVVFYALIALVAVFLILPWQ